MNASPDTPADLDAPPPGLDLHTVLTRGWEFHRQGRLEDARLVYAQVLKWAPDHADALHLLGIAEAQMGNHEAAAELIGRSIAKEPRQAEAHVNRGNALQNLARYEDAAASYNQALALQPRHKGALINRGTVLYALKRYDAALESFDRALALFPDDNDVPHQRAAVLFALGRYEEALANYERDLARNSAREHSLQGRANCLLQLKRYGEAIEACQRLLLHYPDAEAAKGMLLLLKMAACDWDGIETLKSEVLQGVRAGRVSAVPFTVVVGSSSPEDCLAAARIEFRNSFPTLPAALWQGERYAHDKIRIAYVSADFNRHATAYLMAGLFAHHDRTRFETYAISYGRNDQSDTRTRLMHGFDRFIDVQGVDDDKAASLIRELEADIAIDLKGYTQGYRSGILAARPAPIQVNYLGFPGTMAADYIDYLIADRIIVPEDQRRYYTEQLVYLPDCYQCNDDTRAIAATPSRDDAGLPPAGFVFAAFNNTYKITPDIFAVWMRLLRAVEGSVLWIIDDNAEAVRNLKREADAHGVAPSRLVFAPRQPIEQHLARHRLADLFLDTLPCNAHTTASDALWAGLPVLSVMGTTFAGRVAASLLNAVGLPELATDSLDAYEALALRLARDADALAAIKAKLARGRSTQPLFDTRRFTRHLEAAFIRMWEREQSGLPPESFAVQPIERP